MSLLSQNQEAAGWQKTGAGLAIIAAAAIAGLIVEVIPLWWFYYDSLSSGEPPDWLRLLLALEGFWFCALPAVLAIAAGRLSHAPKQIGARGLALAALCLLWFAFAAHLLWFRPLFEFLFQTLLGGDFEARLLNLMISFADSAGMVLLLLALLRVAGGVGLRLHLGVRGLLIGMILSMPVLRLGYFFGWGTRQGSEGFPWGDYLLDNAVAVAALAALLLVSFLSLRGGRRAWGGERPEARELPRWYEPADGLRLYGRAVAARIWILVAGLPLFFTARMSDSGELLIFLTILLAVASLIATVFMWSGLASFAAVPVVNGRGLISGALFFFVVTTVADLHGILSLLSLIFGDTPSSYHLQAMAKEMSVVASAAQVVGLFGVLFLLLSFRKIGGFLGERALVKRAGLVAGMIASAVVWVITARALLDGERRINDEMAITALVLGVGLLALAITALVLFLRLIQALADRMDHRGEPT